MNKKERLRRKQRILRRHKLMIHGLLLVAIIFSLWLEGGKQADWLFVGLGVVTELA